MMKNKTKWPLAIAAVVMMAITWMDTDTEALQTLSADALVPVILI